MLVEYFNKSIDLIFSKFDKKRCLAETLHNDTKVYEDVSSVLKIRVTDLLNHIDKDKR